MRKNSNPLAKEFSISEIRSCIVDHGHVNLKQGHTKLDKKQKM